jgi:hypothetical protein
VWKPKIKRIHGRPGRGLGAVIKMDFKEICCGDVDWTNLAQDRKNWQAVVNMLMTLQSHACGEFFE